MTNFTSVSSLPIAFPNAAQKFSHHLLLLYLYYKAVFYNHTWLGDFSRIFNSFDLLAV
jgi:hypothetical protein